MKVIGITGSSGSGKTTISELLNQKREVKVLNADKMAKKLTNSESSYLAEIKENFAKDGVFLENGTLNRLKLAQLIYQNEEDLKKLNAITFRHLVPQIKKEVKNAIESFQIVVIDAPLLFEAELDEICDVTVALLAPIDLKIKRICKRDNISETMAKSRLKIQQTDEFYKQKSDYIIINDEKTTIEELEQKINKIIN